MKKPLLFIFLIIGSLTFAQSKIELSAGVSNQGQFNKLLEDFYYPAHPTAYQDDAHKGTDLRIKYNLNCSYILKDSFEIRMRFGYAIRKNHYEQSFPNTSWFVDDKQNVFELTPSFGFRRNWGSFSFSTGLEIPIYLVGRLTEYSEYREYSDSINLSYAANSKIQMDGGIIIGLNHYLNIKAYFSKKIYMFSEFNYGILYSKLGRKYQDTGGTTFPIELDNHFEYDKTYSKVYFSSIQVQLGIGYKF